MVLNRLTGEGLSFLAEARFHRIPRAQIAAAQRQIVREILRRGRKG